MIVQEILACLDNLQIEPEYLRGAKKLGRSVKAYASEKANMPQVVGMAKKLVDKWSRMVYGICTTYGTRDDEYETEISSRDQYRKLRQKLSKIQKEAEQEESPSEDEEVGQKRPRKK